MTEHVTISIRAAEHVQRLAGFIGNDGINIVLTMMLLLDSAAQWAGKKDVKCYEALLERERLADVVDDFIAAKLLLRQEARLLGAP